jgi:ATP-dependent Clp protease ATP-binding subunit ClpA
MGVSKQAAQKRFVTRGASDLLEALTAPGTARGRVAFTARGRIVFDKAVLAAQNAGCVETNPTHILLGLLEERGSLAVRIIEGLHSSVDELREDALSLLPKASRRTGNVPLNDEANRIVKLAQREALTLGHSYIGTEHVLLALLQNDGDPARLLAERGVTPEAVSARLEEELDALRNRTQEPPGQ